MAKYIKLVVVKSELPIFFEAMTLVTGKVDEDGYIYAKDRYGVWFQLNSNMTLTGGDNDEKVIEFVKVKTKTIKCTFVDHSNSSKKFFKVGKRYQIYSPRTLGACAGYVFDCEGSAWNLYREEIGFSAGDCYLFEGMYA